MNAKEFLREIRNIDRQIDRETEQAEHIRARLEAGRRVMQPGSARGGKHDWTDTADKLMELEQRINARVRAMVDMKQTALDMLDSVADKTCREVLFDYYINGLTWAEVAERMCYDSRYVFRLHGKGLQQCDEFCNAKGL